jgi:peptidyl-prolyl cis-trans isomerase D
MVKPFNDLIFYEAEQDTLYTVLTQFGVHLVEVTGKKFINNDVGVKLAYVAQPIVPSDNTIDDMYDKALEITSNNRTLSALEETANSDPDLSLESSELLTKNAFSIGTLGAGQTSRDIVRWAFSADEGDISADVYSYQDPVELHVNKYVIVGLETILKAGLPSVEAIKSDIEQLVINQKKGELLTERMQGKDLNALANEFITEVDTAQNISLSVTALPDVGNEPKVVAKAASLPSGQSSEPIIGNSGVFKINVISKSEAGQPGDLTNIRTNLVMSTRSQVLSSLMETLKKDAKITDNRSTFY